jgi:hypothetical protein
VLVLSVHAAGLYLMRLDSRRASLFLANSPTHPASLPVRIPAVERLLSALSRPTLTDRSLAYGYGCRYLPRWVPFNPIDPAPARHTSADFPARSNHRTGLRVQRSCGLGLLPSLRSC